jgi:hypothetical protein
MYKQLPLVESPPSLIGLHEMCTGSAGYIDAHKRYARIRSIAHSCTMKKFEKKFPALLLGNITHEPAYDPITVYRENWKTENRHPASAHWDWGALVEERNADPKQFQLAIWEHCVNEQCPARTLHALAIGRTPSSGRSVRIEYIETYPAAGNPFKGSIFPIVHTALTFYGFLLEAKRVEVINPLPTLVGFYSSYGYTFEENVPGKPQGRLYRDLGE